MSNHKLNQRIFISHSSSDKEFVYEFVKVLRNTDAQLWFDDFDIIPGEIILDKITQGIEESQILILFVSKNSIESSWVKYEWTSYVSRKLNEKQNIHLIPIVLDETNIPSTIKNFKCIKVKKGRISKAVEKTVSSIKYLIKKNADEVRGYETIQLIDREKIIDEEVTVVERHITIKTLSDKPLTIDFHQWQTNPGESSVIRTSIVDNQTQE